MTKEELIEQLKDFPDDMEIMMSLNGAIYVEPRKPSKKFMGTSQKDYIVIEPTLTH